MDRFPLIRARTLRTADFKSPREWGRDIPEPPPRNAIDHWASLTKQLDRLSTEVKDRADRHSAAKRELVAVEAKEGYPLKPETLQDRNGDVRVVALDEHPGLVILDAPTVDLAHIRSKGSAYADDERVTRKGRRKNEPAIAPIERIRLATIEHQAPDLEIVSEKAPMWFELACRGGRRSAPGDNESTREQVTATLSALGSPRPSEFMATETLHYLIRVSYENLVLLVASIDCVYRIELATTEIRDWYLLNETRPGTVDGFTLVAPPSDAPVATLLDSGVASEHPLLASALLGSSSALIDDHSPEDRLGHGTRMMGLALYTSVGDAVSAGGAEARHWIQSVKLLNANSQGSAAEKNRPYWPALTQRAVELAEEIDSGHRVFGLAITAPFEEGPRATTWSHCIDQLAFNDGRGRLMIVSAGNADVSDMRVLSAYPQLNLREKVEDPAQAFNALTVGAYTTKVQMPPDDDYADFEAVAPHGGVSPYTTAGGIGSTEDPSAMLAAA